MLKQAVGKVPGWIWTIIGLSIVFGVPRFFKQVNHTKLIDAAHESCRLWNSRLVDTQREAVMAGMVNTGVDLKAKTNDTNRSVREYGLILQKCGIDME